MARYSRSWSRFEIVIEDLGEIGLVHADVYCGQSAYDSATDSVSVSGSILGEGFGFGNTCSPEE
jgi:hypothetical protein